MTLQFLMPQYNETENIIKPLLDSIALQQQIDMNDIGVIIVNDGSNIKLTENFLKSYSYKIEYYQNAHKGVSATRNACLDYATADYVCWCDADDMFYNMCGLWIVFNEIRNGGFDCLVSCFTEETRNPMTGEHVYINRDMDSTFVHGKFYKRKYLIDKKIRFNDALTIHEDSYFNILGQNCTKKAKYCPTPFYLWKWRDESVCRHDPLYMNKTYTNMLDSNTELVKQFLHRKMKDMAIFYSTMMFYDCYYALNADRWWTKEGKPYVQKTEIRIQEYYKKFKYLIEQCPDMVKNQIIAGIKTRYTQEGVLFEKETFKAWFDRLLKDIK